MFNHRSRLNYRKLGILSPLSSKILLVFAQLNQKITLPQRSTIFVNIYTLRWVKFRGSEGMIAAKCHPIRMTNGWTRDWYWRRLFLSESMGRRQRIERAHAASSRHRHACQTGWMRFNARDGPVCRSYSLENDATRDLTSIASNRFVQLSSHRLFQMIIFFLDLRDQRDSYFWCVSSLIYF